mmetsp:Transcript_39703/g.126857  ORF Transcript_39703/g.126857 Transcript_39703/m.126857 type:complete len:212 (+) Transcript_39703:293-928(+)
MPCRGSVAPQFRFTYMIDAFLFPPPSSPASILDLAAPSIDVPYTAFMGTSMTRCHHGSSPGGAVESGPTAGSARPLVALQYAPAFPDSRGLMRGKASIGLDRRDLHGNISSEFHLQWQQVPFPRPAWQGSGRSAGPMYRALSERTWRSTSLTYPGSSSIYTIEPWPPFHRVRSHKVPATKYSPMRPSPSTLIPCPYEVMVSTSGKSHMEGP